MKLFYINETIQHTSSHLTSKRELYELRLQVTPLDTVGCFLPCRCCRGFPPLPSSNFFASPENQAPELLSMLFDRGSELLIRELPSIFDGSARLKAYAQDDSKATLAPKLKSEESWLSFSEEAFVLHNKVRAFAGWPGTRAKVQFVDGNGQLHIQELKIITTRVRNCGDIHDNKDEITFKEDALIFPCAGCSALEVVEIQPPGKKVMNARDFWNGLRGRKLKKVL